MLGKLLYRILLTKYHDVFTTSDFQYCFKKQHSTVDGTAVVNEIIQYYLNNNTNVYWTPWSTVFFLTPKIVN